MIILLLLLGFATVLANYFYKRHQSIRVKTVIMDAQYPTAMMELPALTLCHSSLAMRHKLLAYLTSPKRIYMPRGVTHEDFENSTRYLREVIHPKNYFPDELDKLNQILSANRLTLLELFENINANCSDLLLTCQFEGKTLPCAKLFEPIVTFYSMCCAFNYNNPREDSQRSNELLKQSSSRRVGSHFILSVLMKSYSSEDRIASIMHGDGVKVLVHERDIYPMLQSEETIAPAGHETIVQLGGNRLTSEPDCMTGCYAGPGRENRQSNCRIECWRSATKKLCGCQTISAKPMEHDKPMCDLTHIPCLARAVLRMASTLPQKCICLPDCKSTMYTITSATAPLNAAQYSPNPFYKEVLRYQNVTALHLTFDKQTVKSYQRQMMISSMYILSNIGGIFNLFLGCSVISFIEILYSLVAFFARMCIGRNRQRDVTIIPRD